MDLRGGKHQRASKRSRAEVELAHAYDEPAIHLPTSAHAFDSAIAFELVKGWAWGSHSATDVQRLAHLVHTDFSSVLAKALHIPTGWIPESITKLAKLGSWGKHPGNIHRDLKILLGDPSVPEAHCVRVPINVCKAQEGTENIVTAPLPVLLPHELFANLYNERRELFESTYIGETQDGTDASCSAKLRAFWSELERRRDPKLDGHEMCRVDGWKNKFIPISLHGDAVPVVRVGRPGTKSYDVYSSSGVLATGDTRKVKQFNFGIYEALKVKGENGTMAGLWKIMLWSLKAAFNGRWPAADSDGRAWLAGSDEEKRAGLPLAGGFMLVLWMLKGDLDHFFKSYGTCSYNSNTPCEYCPAGRSAHDKYSRFNYFGKNVSLKTQGFTARQWRNMAPALHNGFLH